MHLTITRYVYDLSAIQFKIEQGILIHQAKVMQKCILHFGQRYNEFTQRPRAKLLICIDNYLPVEYLSHVKSILVYE